MKLDHILLTTDLSADSLKAFGPIGELARESGARVTLLNIVHDLMVVPHAEAISPVLAGGDMEAHLKRAEEALEESKVHLGPGLAVELVAQPGVMVAEAVTQYADAHGVDLIALTTHGRTGIRHLVLGSVAESILRHAHVPVLCFPPPVDARKKEARK